MDLNKREREEGRENERNAAVADLDGDIPSFSCFPLSCPRVRKRKQDNWKLIC